MTYDPIDTSATDNAADGSVTTDTLDSTTVDNSGTVTTQDIVVNGTATGPFGGGVVLESGDSLQVETVFESTNSRTLITLYNGSAVDVLGGIIQGRSNGDFQYTFSDGSTIHKNGTGTTFAFGNDSKGADGQGDLHEVCFMPPALDVTKVEAGSNLGVNGKIGIELVLKV